LRHLTQYHFPYSIPTPHQRFSSTCFPWPLQP
jgi:hypothetical protein